MTRWKCPTCGRWTDELIKRECCLCAIRKMIARVKELKGGKT